MLPFMKSNTFITINDAYQLVDGAKIRAKKYPEELYVVSNYDADKKGYMVYPFDDGLKFNDFGILITEKELMFDYEIAQLNINVIGIDSEDGAAAARKSA